MCQVWCNSIEGIYAQLRGSICHGYMCIVLYMKLIWCNGFPEIYVQLEEGLGSICHGCMSIVLSMKLFWCNGFAYIYAQLEEGWVNLPWVYVHCAINETYLV